MPELLDIAGQEAALARIQRGLGGDRAPHAMLFAGPRGVGKRTTALALGKTLLCEQPRTQPNAGELSALPADFVLRSACCRCPSCRMADAGTHADLQLIYKELARYHDDEQVRNRVMQELGIDVIRDFLIKPAGRRATGGRGKVFVVLEAELMSQEAQNAMLKTLEEPPPGVTIILICQRAEELLPTTLSRCWIVNFSLLPRAMVRDRLLQAGADPKEADYWATYTDGAVGEALRLAELGMYKVKCALLNRLSAANGGQVSDLAEELGAVAEKLADQFTAEVKQREGADLSKRLALRRAGAVLVGMLGSFFRDALLVAAGADRLLVNADQDSRIRALAERFGAIELAGIIEQLSEYEQLLWRNVSPRLVWVNVAITVSSAQPLRV